MALRASRYGARGRASWHEKQRLVLLASVVVAGVGPGFAETAAVAQEGTVVGKPNLELSATDNRVGAGEQATLEPFVSNDGDSRLLDYCPFYCPPSSSVSEVSTTTSIVVSSAGVGVSDDGSSSLAVVNDAETRLSRMSKNTTSSVN